MAYFGGVVWLSKQQYDELVSTGSITMDGITHEYKDNVLYCGDKYLLSEAEIQALITTNIEPIQTSLGDISTLLDTINGEEV